MAPGASAGAPRLVLHDRDEPDRAVLTAILHAVLRHPVAAQASFAALAAEGRRFAATTEGSAWLQRVQGSPFVERLRLVWEAASLGSLQDDPTVALPDALVETFVAIAARGDLEAFLADWMVGTAPRDSA